MYGEGGPAGGKLQANLAAAGVAPESIQHVLEALPGSFGAYRHYHAGAPPEGESVVHIYEHNIASISPNTPHDPVFWTITFKDQFALRVMAPLPLGL